jgi:SAM-dependent methyltransferase
VNEPAFYGATLARIHDAGFGELARGAGRWLASMLVHAGHREGTVVDLGSGTGILSRVMSDAGYHVVGFDISSGMIELARRNVPEASFEQASVIDVDPPPAVAVTATGEVLNYATDRRAGLDQVESLVGRVRRSLAPGGFFMFDNSTPGRGGETGVVERFRDEGEWVLHMRAEERDGRTLERRHTFFVRTAGGMYRREDETHVLNLYDLGVLIPIVEGAGFTVEVHDTYPGWPPLPGWNVVVAKAPA